MAFQALSTNIRTITPLDSDTGLPVTPDNYSSNIGEVVYTDGLLVWTGAASDIPAGQIGKQVHIDVTWSHGGKDERTVIREWVVEDATPSADLTTDNCYVTIDEAYDYSLMELDTTGWDKADDGKKARALLKATRTIDSLRLVGRRVDNAQPLEFPRSVWSPSTLAWTDQSEVPDDVKQAVVLEAIALLDQSTANRAKLRNQGVKQFSQGELSESYSATLPLTSPDALRLMRRYIAGVVAMR